MGISDIIEIIGAAAWLPQVFQWVSNYFKKQNIFWREGRYEMEMSFDIKGLKRPHEQTFAFSLTRQDVETLKINTEVIRQQIHDLLRGETAEKAIKWQFIWTQVR